MLRKSCVLLLLLLSLAALGRLWHFTKDGFSINRIIYTLPKGGEIGFTHPSLFDTPYRYLGRGRQCYVFESPDQRYVLKIPRFDRYNLPLRWKACPFSFLSPMKKQRFEKGRKTLSLILESFRIASNELKEKTGVVGLHLHETKNLPTHFVLQDRLHRTFTVDLNRIAFILQEKKNLMMPLFLEAIRNGAREKAKAMLDSLLDFLEERARLGIFNLDLSFLNNLGWEEGRGCVQIDIGGFYRKSNLPSDFAYRCSLLDGSGPIQEWLKKIDPELFAEFQRKVFERVER